MEEKLVGTVKFFKNEKGYGFIKPDDGGKDVFVHATGLAEGLKSIAEGDKVSYVVVKGKRGPQASKVELVND